jgi:catechol 2,3-dioxygenase-like lactoylglutathione lyase family enzyme
MRPIGLVPELYVENITRTRHFYVDLLGFKVLYERPEDNFIYMERGNTQMMFEELGVSRNWITGELKYPWGRGINFQIEVEGVGALYAQVQAAGVKPFLSLEEKWYRKNDTEVGNKQFIVQDPDGYLLRFFEDLGSRERT